MTVRQPGPGPGWSKEGLAQPAPAFIGAVFLKREGGCELVAVDLGRTVLETAAGSADALLLADIDLGPRPETSPAAATGGALELADGVAVPGRPLVADGAAVETADPAAVVVAVGRGPGSFLVAGRGPAAELGAALVAAGVTAAVCRPASGAGPWLAVRRESAMTDFAGTPRSEASAGTTPLRVIARPVPLGGRRLELPPAPRR
jgi:hypothetical protein